MLQTLGKLGRPAALVSLLALAACAASDSTVLRPAAYTDDGIVKVPSAYSLDETIARIKAE